MDYDEFTEGVDDILAQLADRLPADVADDLRSYAHAGEWGLVLDGLLATTTKRAIPVTPEERETFRALLAYSNEPTDVLDNLTVAPNRSTS